MRNIWVFSPLVPSKREKNKLVLLSLYFFSRFEGTRGEKKQIFRTQEPKNPCSKSLIFMKMRSTGIRVVGVRILLFCAVNLQGVRCSSYDVIKALGWGFL